jgi:hypothetical protein
MANKNKGGREARKPKKDKKSKAASAPTPIIPPSARQQEHPPTSGS